LCSPLFIDSRDDGPDALPHIAAHPAGRIEHDYGVFAARRRLGYSATIDVARYSHSQRDRGETNGKKKPDHAVRSMGLSD